MKKVIALTSLSLAALMLLGCGGGGNASSAQTSSSEGSSQSALALAENKISLQMGGTYQISPLGATGALTYHSTNDEVATVSGTGLVSAVSAGQAIIRVSDSVSYVLLEVNVKKAEADPILLVTPNKSSLSLTEYDVYLLETEVKYGDNVIAGELSFSSSASDIVTVSSSGLLTAVKKGEATITITAKYNDKTATALVAVSVAAFKLSVTPTFSEREIVKGDNPLALTFVGVSKAGEVALDADSLSVTSSDPTLAKVEGTTLVALAKGTVTLTISAAISGSKVTSSMSIRVRERYTVSYAAVATPIQEQKLLDGEKASKPISPAKDGYIFSGWMSGGAAFDFASEIEQDTVLTPHFLAITSSSVSGSTSQTAFGFTSIADFPLAENSGYNFYDDGSDVVKTAGACRINLQTADKTEYSISLPKLDFASMNQIYFTVGFAYNDMSLIVGDTTLIAAGKYSYGLSFVKGTDGVSAYVDGAKALTLSEATSNGTESLSFVIKKSAADQYASIDLSPIKQNVFDYQSFMASSLATLDAVAVGEESAHFADLAAYESYVSFMTEEEKDAYEEPSSATRIKTALGTAASKILTYSVGAGIPSGFSTDASNTLGKEDGSLYFQLQVKTGTAGTDPFKTSYYVSFPSINFLAYSEVSFTYAYNYDASMIGSIEGVNAIAVSSGVYGQALSFKKEGASVNLYVDGVKKLTLSSLVAQGQSSLRIDLSIPSSGQDYAEIRFSVVSAHF